MQLAFGVIHLHSIVNGLSCHMDWDAYGDLELYLLVFFGKLRIAVRTDIHYTPLPCTYTCCIRVVTTPFMHPTPAKKALRFESNIQRLAVNSSDLFRIACSRSTLQLFQLQRLGN